MIKCIYNQHYIIVAVDETKNIQISDIPEQEPGDSTYIYA